MIAGVAAAAGAPLARVGRDFVLPRSPVALGGRAPAQQRRDRGRAGARGGRGAGQAAGRRRDRVGPGERAVARAAGGRRGRRVARLRAQRRGGARAGGGAAHDVARPPRRAADVDRRRQGPGRDLRGAGARIAGGRRRHPFVEPARAAHPHADGRRAPLLPRRRRVRSRRPAGGAGGGAGARGHGEGRVVVACGSIFLVGQLRAHLRGEPVDPVPTSDPVGRGA